MSAGLPRRIRPFFVIGFPHWLYPADNQTICSTVDSVMTHPTRDRPRGMAYGFRLGSEALKMGFEKWKIVCGMCSRREWVITRCGGITESTVVCIYRICPRSSLATASFDLGSSWANCSISAHKTATWIFPKGNVQRRCPLAVVLPLLRPPN